MKLAILIFAVALLICGCASAPTPSDNWSVNDTNIFSPLPAK